jgi:hypothetical protein
LVSRSEFISGSLVISADTQSRSTIANAAFRAVRQPSDSLNGRVAAVALKLNERLEMQSQRSKAAIPLSPGADTRRS